MREKSITSRWVDWVYEGFECEHSEVYNSLIKEKRAIIVNARNCQLMKLRRGGLLKKRIFWQFKIIIIEIRTLHRKSFILLLRRCLVL